MRQISAMLSEPVSDLYAKLMVFIYAIQATE